MNLSSILSDREEKALSARTIRFLLYCHDTFGLGHLRRTLVLAKHFTSVLPNAEVLIVTGSPVAHAFTLPLRTDYIKLPSVTKTNSGVYSARSLNVDFTTIRDLRAAILLETARAYRPDIFLVDHAPHGLKDEVLPTLTLLQFTQPDCLRVLGLRDIIDASPIIRQSWAEEGIYHTLEGSYDRILVYGSQSLYDISAEYGLSQSITQRVHYCGYLDRLSDIQPDVSFNEEAASKNDSRRERDGHCAQQYFSTAREKPFIVLTAGGGGDGFALMQAYLSGLQRLPTAPFKSILLAGPLMSVEELCQLQALASELPADWGCIETFLPEPLPLLQAADLVVAMAGYNTTCELLALRQRMILVPRVTPRQEQLVRASIFAHHGLAHLLHPDDVTPESLIESIRCALTQPGPQVQQLMSANITFRGQQEALRIIINDLLQKRHISPRRLEVAQI